MTKRSLRRDDVRLAGRLLAGGLLLAVWGCSGEHARLICPTGGDCTLLAGLWPWSEGRSWTYSYGETIWTTPGGLAYPTPEEVPPAPPIDSAAAILDRALTAHPPTQSTGTYRMRFQGTMTTESGAVGKNLVTELTGLAQGVPRSTAISGDPIVRRLIQVRPDLRTRVHSRRPDTWTAAALPVGLLESGPLFLHGYAWDRLPDRIGTYGDLSLDLAWVYLTADLAPGSGFTHQLVPELVDDVYLHAKVTRRLDVQTPAGRFTNCVECVYLIDYGIYTWVTEGGRITGYGRGVDVGSIIYAPGVGPVLSREFRDVESPGYGEGTTIELDLTGHDSPDVALL